ncbi:hypothetical protein K6121_08105 [Neisseria subflava]|jgi:hypothetical protein|uniref:hypothetical protein n=1 Tax=Neisseria subflava TaxID=28449 RepID=UPI001C99DACD|nr:hypothetical protein [Neisseria subflava]MBY6286320.1 hypothetical protein [Neisseria subflava]
MAQHKKTETTDLDSSQPTQNPSSHNTEQKGDIAESTPNQYNKPKWYKTAFIEITMVILSLTLGVCAFYEYFRIPKLTNEIDDLNKKIQKLEASNAYLQNESIVAELTRNNKLLNESLESKKSALASKDQLIQKLERSETNLNYQINELKGNIQKWDSAYKEINSRFIRCSANFGFKREIDNLRQKIEHNNNEINGYAPTERKINTLTIDNQNLNEMIRGYQEKMQCQN